MRKKCRSTRSTVNRKSLSSRESLGNYPTLNRYHQVCTRMRATEVIVLLCVYDSVWVMTSIKILSYSTLTIMQGTVWSRWQNVNVLWWRCWKTLCCYEFNLRALIYKCVVPENIRTLPTEGFSQSDPPPSPSGFSVPGGLLPHPLEFPLFFHLGPPTARKFCIHKKQDVTHSLGTVIKFDHSSLW